MKEYLLCPKRCFIQTDNEKCIGIVEEHCHGACEKKGDCIPIQRTGFTGDSLNNPTSFVRCN